MATERHDEAAIHRAIGGRMDWFLRHSGDRHTQTELGALLGLDQSTVSKKLRGERPFTTPELYKAAVWLDRPVWDFIPSVDDLRAPPPLTASRPPRTRRRRASTSAGKAVVGVDSSEASAPHTHQYVSTTRDFRFSRNVTADVAPVTRAA